MNDIVIQNFYYFSIKLSLKPRINFATSDIMMFIANINQNRGESDEGDSAEDGSVEEVPLPQF